MNTSPRHIHSERESCGIRRRNCCIYFRISLYVQEFDNQFNPFLIRDDEPLLFEAGMKQIFPPAREGPADGFEACKQSSVVSRLLTTAVGERRIVLTRSSACDVVLTFAMANDV